MRRHRVGCQGVVAFSSGRVQEAVVSPFPELVPTVDGSVSPFYSFRSPEARRCFFGRSFGHIYMTKGLGGPGPPAAISVNYKILILIMGYESGSTSHDGRDDEDDDEEFEEAGGGSRLLGFMFGNVDNSGDLDVDYLDEDAKEHLGALADKLGPSLTDLDLSVKAPQTPSDAAEQGGMRISSWTVVFLKRYRPNMAHM
ncbi:hypothetical protein M9H77_20661 [Catharanthus roseus]|uniref:Uncharacterized protein n=1 Tax=Catharanthus roseus TaxID=4058 RepID=A0ACC0AN20_CATRO|nr:hypothetical protein M9H77_20661 [Catharanthus roseus]